MKIRNALGILSSEVPTGNLLWVDAINGIDALAVRGRITFPFRTLSAAKNTAINGDTIIVLPATYVEWDLAKNGVNWHFLIGARVDPGVSATTSLFASSGGNYAVTGYGEFTISGAGKSVVSGTFNDVTFKCIKMTANSSAGCIDVGASSGLLSVECDLAQSVGICANIVSGTNTLKIRDISSTGNSAVYSSGGTTEIEAFRIKSTGGAGVFFTGGTLTVAAVEISSSVTYAVDYENSTLAVCTIIGARLVSTLASSSGRAVYLGMYTSANTNALRLSRCVLVPYATAESIGALNANTLNLHGECVAKTSKGANVTIASPGSSLNVNSNIA